jgi:hypothetical protein
VKIGLALGETAASKQFGSKFYALPFPGCEHLLLSADEYWACITIIIQSLFTIRPE